MRESYRFSENPRESDISRVTCRLTFISLHATANVDDDILAGETFISTLTLPSTCSSSVIF